jgi:hypothetical protein
LAFSSNGKILASAESHIIPLSSPPEASGPATALGNGGQPPPPPLHTRPEKQVYTIRLSDVATGQKLRQWEVADGISSSLTVSPDGRMLASRHENTLILWEVASGKERRRFTERVVWSGHKCAAFSPDGRTLVWNEGDGRAQVWDMTGVVRQGRARTVALGPGEREALWADLAGADAGRAFRAIQALSASPKETVPLLRQGVPRAAEALDDRRIARLITDLDSDRFAVREQAARELEKLGSLAEPDLRRARSESASAEVRRRVGGLLTELGSRVHPELLRALRSVEVLENIGTAEARRLLQGLAEGDAGNGVAQEAKGSLDRLARRTSGTP